MIKDVNYQVEELDEGDRIDKFLVKYLSTYTRSAIQKEIKDQTVLVNGKGVKANHRLAKNDLVTVRIPLPEKTVILPEDIPLNIIYEDDHIIVVNKEAGMLVHPTPNHSEGTLVNALVHHTGSKLSSIGEEIRPGIVHRIDRDTSGLLVVAKTNVAHERLAQMVQGYEITRIYHAIVNVNMKDHEGIIDEPIGRQLTDRYKRMVTDLNGKDALTSYKVLEQLAGYTYVEITLHTGRTHQIRVHMNHIGHPVLGDLMYGPKKQPYSSTGQLLHAKKLGFNHPVSNEYMEFDSCLPVFFDNALKNLKDIL